MVDIDVGYLSEAINDKADRDINNLTTSGYAKGSGLGMPSDKYIDLTLGASDTEYVAPANGWVYIWKRSSNSGTDNTLRSVTLKNLTKDYGMGDMYSWGISIRAFLPVCKDDLFTVSYTAIGTTECFRFYYAEGEQ